MALDPVTNFGRVEVDGTYSDSATSVTLNTGEAAKLPDPATDGEFNLVWFDSSNFNSPSEDPNVEIVRVTAVSGDTLTISRAQENTTATTKNSGTEYLMLLGATQKTIEDIEQMASPAGLDTQVQFNDGGVFGGDSGLTYDKVNKSFTVGEGRFSSGVHSETTSAFEFTPNALSGNIIDLTISVDITIETPTNPIDGQRLIFRIRRSSDASGDVTPTFSGQGFRFGDDFTQADIEPITGTDVIYVGVVYNQPDDIWDVLAYTKSYG